MGIPRILQTTSRLLTNHTPLVLTSIGVAGVVASAVLTGKATFKAAEILTEENLASYWVDSETPPHFITKAKLVWKLYIPPISVAALTITTIVMANRIGTRRTAALAAAYSLSEKAFGEYRDKIVEKMGPTKERQARDELAEERAARVTIPQSVVIPGDAKVRCFDQYSRRWFQHTQEGLKKAQNDTNYKMIHHDASSLNDFYAAIGLDPVPYGELVGWDAMDKLELVITSILPEDGIPSISIDFYNPPKPEYSSLH